MRFFLTFILFIVSASLLFSQDWIEKSENLLNNGFHQKSIDLILQNINQQTLSSNQKSKSYLILADNYLTLGETEKFKNYAILSFKILENKNGLDSSLYFSNLGLYNHYKLRSDSSTFYAVKSLKLLETNFKNADSSLISRIYKVYGNCMRNAIFYYPEINRWEKGDSLILMRRYCINYLEKSLSYANKYQKPNILRIIGNLYNDMIALNQDMYKNRGPFIGLNEILDKGVETYRQAIDLGKKTYKNPNRFLSQCYSLLALDYHYMKEYKTADSLYNFAVQYATQNNNILHLNEYNTVISWKGWNYEEWYKSTHDVQYLYKSLSTYESSVNSWLGYYKKVGNKNKGLDDAYRISTLQKIPNSCYNLFQLTNDSSYIDKALYYGDLDIYPTYSLKKNSTDSITVKSLQQNLKDDEAIVVYLSSNNPNKTHAIIITKSKVDFIFINNIRLRTSQENYNHLSGFGTTQQFKTLNYRYYNYLFKPIDSLLTLNNSKNVIIVPSSEFSQLNFDLLISDTLSNKWKDYPYMFHKYNFSYGLNLTILNDNYKFYNPNKSSIGVIDGEFNKKTNLIFSNKLINGINANYTATLSSPTNLSDFKNEVNNHDIILLVGHGWGNYTTSNSRIYLADSVHIDSDQLTTMNFNNSLFITTACNTNQSSTYISEGNTGGFTKALIYSGIKSTITTNWEIDDKTNSYIMKRFFHYLAEGKTKSVSLWLSKKDYWNNCKQDEEFNPFYWSPYRLTGNTSSIIVKRKTTFNYYYLLLLLLVPLGVIAKRKWF
jgi:CHAT domain-containing protein